MLGILHAATLKKNGTPEGYKYYSSESISCVKQMPAQAGVRVTDAIAKTKGKIPFPVRRILCC